MLASDGVPSGPPLCASFLSAIAASVESSLDPITASIEPSLDPITAPIESSLDSVATSIESLRLAEVAVCGGAMGSPVEPPVYPVSALVEPPVYPVSAPIEPGVDAIAQAIPSGRRGAGQRLGFADRDRGLGGVGNHVFVGQACWGEAEPQEGEGGAAERVLEGVHQGSSRFRAGLSADRVQGIQPPRPAEVAKKEDFSSSAGLTRVPGGWRCSGFGAGTDGGAIALASCRARSPRAQDAGFSRPGSGR